MPGSPSPQRAGTNSATFRVTDPMGKVLGDVVYSGSGASATFANRIKFAITDGSTDFVVGDGKARVPVRFTGITPDLFVEGSGVVAEGRMEGGTFVADNLLAKHDEKYVPREMKDMSAAQAKKVVAETK